MLNPEREKPNWWLSLGWGKALLLAVLCLPVVLILANNTRPLLRLAEQLDRGDSRPL